MAMTEDGKKFIVPMRMGPMGDHKTFSAALSRFAADNALTEEDFAYVAVTGGRAAEAVDRILDVPVRRINEIEAMAAGALRFSAREKGVVVNMGTGTALVYAEQGKAPRHIFGSAVGGGTLMGLLSRFGRPERPYYDWFCPNCGGYRVRVREDPLLLEVLEQVGGETA